MNETPLSGGITRLKGIRYIDQTLLPGRYAIVECRTIGHLATAIKRLEIRGHRRSVLREHTVLHLRARSAEKNDLNEFFADVCKDAEILRTTRPTAVNLGWGIDRVLAKIEPLQDIAVCTQELLWKKPKQSAREDTACCHAIGTHGAALLPDTCTVLTHCNAGALACSSWGTALGVIRSAVEAGKQVNVIACETRPLLQGARLTAWELARDGIEVTVITDSAAAHLMRTGTIDAVIVGADRITCDAVFNKIGTYMHAVCARHHNIPFYVAAPLSTFDTRHKEEDVIIEERGRNEVTTMGDRVFVPDAARVKNYAFDATPMDLVTAIITEQGVIRPPVCIDSIISSKNT